MNPSAPGLAKRSVTPRGSYQRSDYGGDDLTNEKRLRPAFADSTPQSMFLKPIRQWVWIALFLFRVGMAVFWIQTADVPDEWYQSTELAYTYLFGKGHYTWEWKKGIRSFAYPLPFAVVFKVLTILGLDSAWMFWAVPKALAGCVAFGIDRGTYKLAQQYFGESVARNALRLSVLSWWIGYAGCRTLSNSIETLCLLVALQQTQFFRFLMVSGLGCALRITFFLPVMGPAIVHLKDAARSGRFIGAIVTAVGAVVFWLGLITAIDFFFYKRLLCTPLAFLEFNFFQGLSEFFGTHSWHWYVSQALPTEIGPAHMVLAPFLVHLLWFTPREKASTPTRLADGSGTDFYREVTEREFKVAKHFLSIIVITVLGYSTLAHKELRFILPLIPLCFVLLALPLSKHPAINRSSKLKKGINAFIMVEFLVMFFLFAFMFQRGTLDALKEIRSNNTKVSSLHVLMGCHSMPSYSYTHNLVERYVHVDCELATEPMSRERVPTERDFFVANATAFTEWFYFKKRPRDPKLLAMLIRVEQSPGYQGHRELPEMFIMFNRTAYQVKKILLEPFGYERVRQYYHTFWLMDDLDSAVDVWKRRPSELR
jgi:phosphatidylinositol glycan class B